MRSRVPTTSCRTAGGSHVLRAYPAAAVKAARATSAAAVPASADRHPRVTPMARTMVRASTNSTNEAVKVEAVRPHVAPGTWTPGM